MILIICAAGRGSRIRTILKNKPKSLISFNGITVLENLLSIFNSKKISKIIIIVGYKKDKIIKKVGYKFNDKKITYVFNNKFKTTNNMYSLMLTKKHINQDIIFVASDLYLEKNIKVNIDHLKKKNFILVNKNQLFFKNEDLTKVNIKKNVIKSLGKKEFTEKISAVAPGMCGMSKKNFIRFIKISEQFIRDKKYQFGYNEVIKVLIKNKLNFFPFNPKKYIWRNINKAEDIKYLENKLKF
jgi:choline kinase